MVSGSHVVLMSQTRMTTNRYSRPWLNMTNWTNEVLYSQYSSEATVREYQQVYTHSFHFTFFNNTLKI